MKNLNEKLTVLVNSCDAYSDLWDPFFTLFNKFGGELKTCTIVLNADKMKYSHGGGLTIQCPNNFESGEPWGKRVKNCLKTIKTDYVLELLDDFFLQRECDINIIKECITWLDQNKNIGAFNLLSLKDSEEESLQFPKFCYIKNGTKYRLNSQACIWRKEIFDKSLMEQENPWEWEILGNKRNSVVLKDFDFYCISEKYSEPYFYNSEFCNKKYSQNTVKNAVIRGKWDLSCIDACFKENGIVVDYSIRGLYKPQKTNFFKKVFNKFKGFISIKNRKRYNQLVKIPLKNLKKQSKNSA